MEQKDRNEEMKKLQREYRDIQAPEEGRRRMEQAIERAKKEKKRRKRNKIYRGVSTAAAAALLLFVLLPNLNRNVAMAMERIPALGSLIRVITFGRYDYEDEYHQARVEIPELQVEDAASAPDSRPDPENGHSPESGQIQDTDQKKAAGTQEALQEAVEGANQDISAYVEAIVQDFKDGLSEEDRKALDISYDVITDTDAWFTLRINVLEVQASGYEYSKFVNINKSTGERQSLSDLFPPGTDYVAVISEEVKRQMREQMAADEGKIYFLDNEELPDDNFQSITPDHNYYLNEKGEIVIAFDEYEVAPGYMGRTEFVIPADVLSPL